ncbi:hypothetical protein DPMN_154438 [Dreissena polymorpha]|uniref:Uncharacterized protein n=1 Tax=Dreissena polymorpha TaxID=45954 RepID=A0A9D4J6Z3_DREPO|nr:hypothetical protein DPMN_154438 [Dreissena polymorpha]
MFKSIGIFYPAAPRGNDNVPVVCLPSHFTKLGIYKEYEQLCISTHARCMKLSAFIIIWASCTPHIKIAHPRDDACAKCESLRKDVASSVSEEEKMLSTTALQNHIVDARKVRCNPIKITIL